MIGIQQCRNHMQLAKELCHSYESGEPKLLKVREAEAKKKTLFRNLKMGETVLIHSFI